MLKVRFKQLLGLIVAAGIVTSQGTWALAGTTGTLNGQVLQLGTNAPLVDAKVTVTSSSQNANSVTDGTGHFTFVSLSPDTYTVSVSKNGFEPASLAGVTVFADQQQTVSITVQPALKEIGHTTSRAANALVKSGTTADIYSVSARDQQAAATLGGGGGLNNAYSAIASVPGVFVPQGQKGEYQSIFVRGGNYTQVGYEFDGVPIQRAFDQYPGGSLSSIGSQELQVYTGTAPVNTDSTALAGFINQVIKTGTYPGYGGGSFGIGSPYFYHQLGAEAGGASPDRNFSYFVGYNGYNQNFVYEKNNQFSSIYGPPVNALAANCNTPNPTAGCYLNGNGPNGYEHGPIFWGSNTNLASRDIVANVHIGLPHRKDGGKDDIQLLYTADYVRSGFSNDLADLAQPFRHDILTGTITNPDGSITPACTALPVLSATPPCSVFQGAGSGYVNRYTDKIIYTGALGTTLGAGDLSNTQTLFFPGSPQQRLYSTAGSPVLVPLTEQDSYQQNGAITKLQYQHNMGSNAFIRLYGYTAYSDWLQYGVNSQDINSQLSNFGGISSDYKLGAHTSGVALNFTDQINPQHLLNVNASYTTSNTFRYNNSAVSLSGATNSASTNTVAFLVDSTNPAAGICYRATGVGTTAAVDCGNAASSRYINPQTPAQCAGGLGALCTAHASDPTVANVGTYACNGHPCSYFTAANGVNATFNTVTPKFSSISIQDSWRPTDKLLLALGLRYDDFKYVLPDTTGGTARAFWVNYYNNYFCYNPTTQTVTQLSGGTAAVAGTCAATQPGTQQVAFSATSPSLINDYPELQPRLSGTYTINPNNVIRFSAGKSAEPASSAFQQYNTLAPNIFAGTNQLFYALGYNNPRHVIYPEESYNYDFSWEHQVNGSDMSWKLTPYIRTTKNELSTVLLDPQTSFVSSVNVGQKNVKGIEFIVRKGNLNRDGWYGQLSYTYTYAREKFTPLPNGKTVVDGLNVNAIQPYNRLTSFCTSNPTDPRCGTGTLGAPCYAKGTLNPATGQVTPGAPAPCGPSTVANPYWNMPVQSLFDPNGNYAVYNTLAGNRFVSGSNQSYVVPHVASLVLNYKHDRWNITPTFQIQAGGEYGRPTQGIGINPATCVSTLATPIAGDPRYPNGAPGGSPYNASTCGGLIVAPDLYTGRFDNYGQFKEPSIFAGNLSLSYEISKKVSTRLDLVNVVTSCFGGSSVPWAVGGKAGCDYGPGGVYTGNFYNPGDVIDQYVKYPYNPNFGSVFQTTGGGQGNPFAAYFTVNFKV